MRCNYHRRSRTPKAVRLRSDRWIAGVCGGMGQHFDVDPMWLRVGFVVGFFMTSGALALFYLLCIIVMPVEGSRRSYQAHDNLREARFQARAGSHATFRNNREAMEELARQFDSIEAKVRRLEDHVTSRDYVLERKFAEL